VVTLGSDDPANPRPTLATLEPPSTGPDGARNITEDGLAPNDVVAGTLELVDPDAIQGRLSRLKWQQIAAQMAAQDFPWDVDRLSARECQLLMQVARACVHDCARQPSPGALELGRGAMLGALSLWLGQPAELLAEIEVITLDAQEVERDALRRLVDRIPARLTLVVRAAAPDERAPGALAFLVPAISPKYADDDKLPSARAQLGRARTGHLVLDAGVCGRMLVAYARSVGTAAASFPLRESEVSPHASLEAFLQHVHLTARPPGFEPARVRIETTLPRMVRHLTGEPTAAWLICHQSQRTAEARLYYTQHRLDTLARLHADGVRALELETATREREPPAVARR
jgi:hypothetical protein